MLRSLDEAWATHIRTLLFEHGFGYIWIANTVGDANRFIKTFSQRIKDISIQKWRSRLNDTSKAEHYRHFKFLLDIEKYLFTDLTYVARKTLANFRCSGHNLMIKKVDIQMLKGNLGFVPFA